MNALRFLTSINCGTGYQSALIGIINPMISGSEKGINLPESFTSPFSMKELHGKGCVAKPKKKKRAGHKKKTAHVPVRPQWSTMSAPTMSSAVTPLDKASPATCRRNSSKGKKKKPCRPPLKSPPADSGTNSVTSLISPFAEPTSYRLMMRNGIKQAWREKSGGTFSRASPSLKGKDTRCSIISMDFKANVVERPFCPSNRRYYHYGRPTCVEDVGRELGKGHYKHIIVMSGAGISTPSGIPDFRTPGTGLYDNLQQYNLTSATDIFDITFFPHNPKPFFALAKELYPGTYQPNIVHRFIHLLEQKGVLLRNYTQNIDGLERLAGVKTSKLVEAHGSFFTASCIICKSKQNSELVKEKIFNDEIPKCSNTYCKGLVKPDVVFFGEDLPTRFHTLQTKDFSLCDLLIVMGTSLEVEPFASLVSLPRNNVPRVLLNRELVGPFKSRRKKQIDFALTGDLVSSVKEISRLAGWLNELEKLSSGNSDDHPGPVGGHVLTSGKQGSPDECLSTRTGGDDSPLKLNHSQSQDLACEHLPSCSSPLKEPRITLQKLQDSPELQHSLQKLFKSDLQTMSQDEQIFNRVQRPAIETVSTKESVTTDGEDVTLCASISNMSIT